VKRSGACARLLGLLLAFGVACGYGSPPKTVPAAAGGKTPALQALTPAPGQDGGPTGVSLVPLSIPQFIFGPPVVAPQVQPASGSLVSLAAANKRLHVQPLPSPIGTAAIDFVEDSTPALRWGELMWPAQRKMFAAFAADPTLGDFLVIVDDVNILGGPDPVPLTAYRWARENVETYAQCGIPRTAIDACTVAFYATPQVIVISTRFQQRGQ
jgi:hypothetical protein